MTVGNRTVDLRSLKYLSWQGFSGQMGAMYNVNWTGGDRSSKTAQYEHHTYSKYALTLVEDYTEFLYGGVGGTQTSAVMFWVTATETPPLGVVSDNVIWNKIQKLVAGHDFNAGVAFAEGNKTLAMLGDTVKRVFRARKAVIQGDVLGALKALGYRSTAKPHLTHNPVTGHFYSYRKARVRSRRDIDFRNHYPTAVMRQKANGVYVQSGASFNFAKQKPGESFSPANLWLELKYGWMPLLQDVQSAADAYFALTNRPRAKTVFASDKKEGPEFQGAPDQIAKFSVNKRIRSRRFHVEMVEDYKPSSSLGLNDPLSIAWELVPFSFVVDWFLPVSSYLSARSFVNDIKATYWWTDKTSSESLVYARDALKGSGNTVLMPLARWYRRKYEFYRSGIYNVTKNVPWAFGVDGCLPKFPSLKSSISEPLVKMITAASLVQQRRGR